MRSLRGRLYHRPDATAVFRTRGLVTAKPTACGRVTQRASSDPACFSPTCEGFGRLSGDRGQAREFVINGETYAANRERAWTAPTPRPQRGQPDAHGPLGGPS